MAWVSGGDGVLFIDADGNGAISNQHEYAFSEWAGGALDDLDGLRRAFDSNGDGKLTAADARWNEFRVEVTKADGSTEVKTLAQLGITEINLTADTTMIQLADGSSINGQTTFVMGGITRTVANATLMAEAQAWRVTETVSTDANGNRVVVQTGYDRSAVVKFVVQSVTSPNGRHITNSYDVDGDGTVDRLQTIVTSVAADGTRTETVTNKTGAVSSTAVTTSRTVTTTSADGKQVTIQRDTTGGGWFDETETLATATNGARTRTISDLTRDGTVIQSTSETISANGLTRTTSDNLDGVGGADLVTTKTQSTNATTGVRTETTTFENADGTSRGKTSLTVSSDGRTRTTATDLNGDSVVDVTETRVTTIPAAGGTVTTETVTNADGSVRARAITTVSADGLSTVNQHDLDGDGDYDRRITDQTVVEATGRRIQTITTLNQDGSLREASRTVLETDGITSQAWVDLDRDGIFEPAELVRQVAINPTNAERVTTTWARNPDGSVKAILTEVTQSSGLTTTVTEDSDADGDIDRRVVDTTVVNADLSTRRTVTETNQDASRRSLEWHDASADGLTKTVSRDFGGSNSIDSIVTSVTAKLAGGAASVTVSEYSGTGAVLLSQEITTDSADRLTRTVSKDVDGDGVFDQVASSVEAVTGERTITESRYDADGGLASRKVSTVSANGLSITTTVDEDGDGSVDFSSTDVTSLLANGGTRRTVSELAADGSLNSRSQSTLSDDRLVSTVRTDADGDGVYELTTTATTVLLANGGTQETKVVTSADGSVLSREQIEVSDTGLVRVERSDADGDGDFDLVRTSTTVLLANGDTQLTEELREANGNLRSRRIVTTSDDGRLVIEDTDVTGDGVMDRRVTRTLADDGTLTTQDWTLDAAGVATSAAGTLTSDDGLYQLASKDIDGDGVDDEATSTLTTLNANGSVTEVQSRLAGDGSLIARVTTLTSDDGWSKTTSRDLNGDGVTDFTSQSDYLLTTSGSENLTTTDRSADNSLLSKTTVVTTADGRQVTKSTDSDGDGYNERVEVRVLGADGRLTTTTTVRSASGALESQFVSIQSGDGLRLTQQLDREGDGTFDLVLNRQTLRTDSGRIVTTSDWTNDRHELLGRMRVETSADERQRRIELDHNGDGVFEHRSEISQQVAGDGTITVTQETFDAQGVKQAEIVTRGTGDGLESWTLADYSGDGIADRTTHRIQDADGAIWQETRLSGPSTGQTTYVSDTGADEVSILIRSADGLNETRQTDFGADGRIDTETSVAVGADRGVTTTMTDFTTTGEIRERVTEWTAETGTNKQVTFDIDGDGDVDVTHLTTVAFQADGDRVTTLTHVTAPFSATFGPGRTSFFQQTIASADGLSSVTKYDLDGDGTMDGKSTFARVINADGSQTETTVTTYADGDLRARRVTETSADGRTIKEMADYDGNGVADHITETVVSADGSRAQTTTSYDQRGMQVSTFVTLTSADGLETRIIRPDAVQTITHSVVGDGSYTWNNGRAASSTSTAITVQHLIDGHGIETWTATRNWVQSGTAASDVTTVRLDASARERVLAEAARLFDTVLDRNLDQSEIETMIFYIKDGRLDRKALSEALVGSSEFTTRYGAMTAMEFLTQIYLNTLQRAPSMEELNAHIAHMTFTGASGLSVAEQARIAMELAESVEHLAIGNGHLATNNFDVIMNPAVFERSLDRAWVEDIIRSLVDVAYDRDATQVELDFFGQKLLNDTLNPDDIAAQLLTASGAMFGVGTTSLMGLTGAALVRQAFLNALDRHPTAEEQAAWEANLAAGRLTAAQLVASLAMSVEKDATGHTHVAPAPAFIQIVGSTANDSLSASAMMTSIDGGAGNDTLVGGANADLLVGGIGDDALMGGDGSDIYRWQRGFGNDYMWDSSYTATAPAANRLELLDVASTEVALSYGIMDMITEAFLDITTNGVTERITFWMGSFDIVFSDGVIWTTAMQAGQMTAQGTGGNDSLLGYWYGDVISGLGGNDTLTGFGNDTLDGGTGNDSIDGGIGQSVIRWFLGDGNDTINDTGTLVAEVDRLDLANVMDPASVQLVRAQGSWHLQIRITNGNTVETITHLNWFYNATTSAVGIEAIEFGDGTVWTIEDIYERTIVSGAGGNDSLTGTNRFDHVQSGAGNDTIRVGAGEDTLNGGTGNDVLVGEAGSDTYRYTLNDGNDTISDQGTSIVEVDRLELSGINPSGVTLQRADGSWDLWINIGTQRIVVQNHFNTWGLEEIVFADGTVWNSADIFARSKVSGDNASNVLDGISTTDNLHGHGANDTLYGGAGDDYLYGGTGVDYLDGGAGSDRYFWATGDGNDTIYDDSNVAGEMDSLKLTNVNANGVTLSISGHTMLITVTATGEVISVPWRFHQNVNHYGIEVLEFADGTAMRIMQTATATIQTTGTTAANTLTGWFYIDRIEGGAGNDSIYGGYGDDSLYGGAGVDYLDGGEGNDTFFWATGGGNDTIYDGSNTAGQRDVLSLTDVLSDGVSLSISGHTLLVKVTATGEVISVPWRFHETGHQYGVEAIEFADGTVWEINEIRDRTERLGTTGNDNLSTTHERDLVLAGAGNDTITAHNGNDTLNGGTGNDSLNGGNGLDTYVWARGDGNDIINDGGATLTETDTLVLRGVAPADLDVTRAQGSTTLVLTIGGAQGGTISVLSGMTSAFSGYGIERIVFDDGTIWDHQQIQTATHLIGTGAGETLTSTAFAESIFGRGGNDLLYGGDGDDTLAGEGGNDQLFGDNGGDTYVWRLGDGEDTLNDNVIQPAEADVLHLVDVNSSAVTLIRSGTNDLNVRITTAPGEYSFLTVVSQYYGITAALDGGYGIEVIRFADGSEWALEDIRANAGQYGGSGNDTLTGSAIGDRIFGGTGNDTINAMAGDDSLEGGLGADRLDGGAGSDLAVYSGSSEGVTVNLGLATAQTGSASAASTGDVLVSIEGVLGSAHSDLITGNAGSNLIRGAAGNDTLSGLDGFDQIYGDTGNDSILGGAGVDLLDGGGNNDTLIGDAGGDSLYGASGDDLLVGGDGADMLVGGSGIDLAAYWDATAGLRADLQFASTNTGFAAGDTYVDVENLYGSNHADILAGGSGDNVIYGNAGNDMVYGRAGNDILAGGAGADGHYGGEGLDAASYADATAAVRVDLQTLSNNGGWATGDTYSSIEYLYASSFADTLRGNADANYLVGYAGNDSLQGRDGDDNLAGGDGADILDGGNGTDWASYWDATAAVRADLQYATTNTGFAAGDTFVLIENLNGSNHGDVLAGDTVANVLNGLDGNDALYGRDGNDTLLGDTGNDTLEGGNGTDQLDGGSGVDFASYSLAVAAVRADLQSPATNTGEAAGDTFISVEGLIGTSYGDSLLGNSAANTLFGKGGSDLLDGRSGNDTVNGENGDDLLYGGAGNDNLTGGAGVDQFVFNAALGATNVDTITDFVLIDDTITLENAIFTALTATGTLASTAFVNGTAASSAAHRIIYNTSTGELFYDADGSGSGAKTHFATVTSGLVVTAADFLVI